MDYFDIVDHLTKDEGDMKESMTDVVRCLGDFPKYEKLWVNHMCVSSVPQYIHHLGSQFSLPNMSSASAELIIVIIVADIWHISCRTMTRQMRTSSCFLKKWYFLKPKRYKDTRSTNCLHWSCLISNRVWDLSYHLRQISKKKQLELLFVISDRTIIILNAILLWAYGRY